ncbi:hypothetical protein [Sorangium sp. So ce388]|uniref:hypothetical protein n=1 Tax=Sorangium sp. So ce388 TaxID=3133309 RepID=UPI003F5C77B5
MTLEELLAAVAAELRVIGMYVVPEALATDAERADALLEAGATVRTEGRRIYLRFAVRFLGRAFEARAAAEPGEPARWAARAEAELERYREPAPELQPYSLTTGGAS